MKALGITDERTTCDCCGKSDLKCTVAMESDGGEIVYYGRTCAGRNSGKSTAVINREIADEEARRVRAARAEYAAHPHHLAERARFAERDRVARETGARMVGTAAMEFVREATEAATIARVEIAGRHNVRPAQLYI